MEYQRTDAAPPSVDIAALADFVRGGFVSVDRDGSPLPMRHGSFDRAFVVARTHDEAKLLADYAGASPGVKVMEFSTDREIHHLANAITIAGVRFVCKITGLNSDGGHRFTVGTI